MGAPQKWGSIGDVLVEAHAAVDWTSLRALVDQSRHIRSARSTRELPADLRDALAECLTGLIVSYRGHEERFVAHLLAVMAEIDDKEAFDPGLFRTYYVDGPHAAGTAARPLPAVFETVVETSRRLRDARRLEDELADVGTAGILCGSTSYGPFYNVRGVHGRQPASDLDVVVVVEDAARLTAVVDRLGGLSGTGRQSIEQLRARAELFREKYDDGHTALSHKVDMWVERPDPLLAESRLSGEYHLSLHLLTGPVLGYVLVESSTALNRHTVGGRRTVRDYRDTATRRPDLPRTFAGREYPIVPKLEPVELGWMRWTTACQFDDAGCYCPGFLQTILLPLLDVRWDEIGCRPRLQNFARKYLDRYRLERASMPHALLRPSFTHVRRDVFAPHVIRRFDGNF